MSHPKGNIKSPLVHKDLLDAQVIILEIFSGNITAEQIHEAVEESTLPEELKQWLLSSDPNMLETAAQLVKKWGSKDPSSAVGIDKK